MLDARLVAEKLECFRMKSPGAAEHCTKKECPYNNNDPRYGCWCVSNKLLYDAVNLLKEQEPVKPREVKCGKHWDLDVWTYVCGECGSAIDTVDVYCRHCGRKVKWE